MGYKDPEKKRQYQLDWMNKRREKYLTGKECVFCHKKNDLCLHHIHPEDKDSHRIWSWSDDRIKAEIQKCVVMCGDCHNTLHGLERRAPLAHGTRNGYDQWGCRCDACKKAHRDHIREFRANKARRIADGI